MNNKKQFILGRIIGLKKESEHQDNALHRHSFHEVLNRINKSNISDYTIFHLNGLLFSYIAYSGDNYEADMRAMGTDKSTQEWWKLTGPMQPPPESGKENEWWAGISLWFSHEFQIQAGEKLLRFAYTVPTPFDLQETIPDDCFGDIDFWGSTYDLKTIRIFKGAHNVYIYLETTRPSDHTFLLEIIARVLKTDGAPVAMTEVFHSNMIQSL